MDCIICGEPCRNDPIELRGGLRVCARCIARREAGLREIESQISRLKSDKPSKNMWDILRYLVILFSVVFGVYALFLIPIPFAVYAGLLIGLLGIILANYASVRSDKWNEPHNLLVKNKINQLMSEAESVRREIQAIYDRYRDRPPDWEERCARVIARDNGKCRQCGRRMSGSRVPFHVHHINPSSKKDADHELSNLMLLCEICHSKMDSPGHHLIKVQRKKRLSKGSLLQSAKQAAKV